MLCVANWKMHGRLSEIREYVSQLSSALLGVQCQSTLALICPPACYLLPLQQAIANQGIGHLVHIGAQDCFLNQDGDYNGEISPNMLLDVGAYHVIIGCQNEHNRQSLRLVQQKLLAATNAGMYAILCVNTSARVEDERLVEQFANIPAVKKDKFVIACEFDHVGTVELEKIRMTLERVETIMKRSAVPEAELIYYGSLQGVDLCALLGLGFAGIMFNDTKFVAREFAQKFSCCEKSAATK